MPSHCKVITFKTNLISILRQKYNKKQAEKMLRIKYFCANCEFEVSPSDPEPGKLQDCEGCRFVKYCSFECQQQDFLNHLEFCAKRWQLLEEVEVLLVEYDIAVDISRRIDCDRHRLHTHWWARRPESMACIACTHDEVDARRDEIRDEIIVIVTNIVKEIDDGLKNQRYHSYEKCLELLDMVDEKFRDPFIERSRKCKFLYPRKKVIIQDRSMC